MAKDLAKQVPLDLGQIEVRKSVFCNKVAEN